MSYFIIQFIDETVLWVDDENLFDNVLQGIRCKLVIPEAIKLLEDIFPPKDCDNRIILNCYEGELPRAKEYRHAFITKCLECFVNDKIEFYKLSKYELDYNGF